MSKVQILLEIDELETSIDEIEQRNDVVRSRPVDGTESPVGVEIHDGHAGRVEVLPDEIVAARRQ